MADRTADIRALIPAPPRDVAPLRQAFSMLVAKLWNRHVPRELAIGRKSRFIGEMYARACYSVLMISPAAPVPVRYAVRGASLIPQPRPAALKLAVTVMGNLETLLPDALHRQAILISALMGMLDVVLDEAAGFGESAALRVAALVSHPTPLSPQERVVADLAAAVRKEESVWQGRYWQAILEEAILRYCRAEYLAVKGEPDPTGMGHRWAGIDAAIKGMWYAIGPAVGLKSFEQPQWNAEQRWMADTSLLMQMIDDWVDQDEDRPVRATPVTMGEWTLDGVGKLYAKTTLDLGAILSKAQIDNPVVRKIFLDLYNDYLHTAVDAMHTGVAA